MVCSVNRKKTFWNYPNKNIDKPDQKQGKPNILFVMADDLGFNDVSWHNDKILMPTLTKLAEQGVILEQHYSLPVS